MNLLIAATCACLFISRAAAEADPVTRTKYSPYPQDGYPQIIQKNDYATICFIESLFRSLLKVAPDKEALDQFGRSVNCEVAPNALTFRSQRHPKKAVVIRRAENKMVLVSGARFTRQPTIVLYSTLLRVLSDLSRRGACRGVRFVQYATRTYKKRTIIEFDFGAEIVVIDSLSNGPKNEERLYILDVVQRKDSMFWSHERAVRM